MGDGGETTFFSIRMRDDGEITIFIPLWRHLTPYIFMTWVVGMCGGLIIGYVAVIDGGLASFPKVVMYRSGEIKEMNHFVNLAMPLITMYSILLIFCSTSKRIDLFETMVCVESIYFGCFLDWHSAKPKMSRRIYDFALHMGLCLVYLAFRSTFELPRYMCEMAPSSCHDFLILSFELMIAMGIFLGHLVNYATCSGWSFLLAVIPAYIMSMGYFLLPHTPIYMIEKGESGKARDIISLIHGTENIHEVDNKYFDLVRSHAIEKESTMHSRHLMMDLLVALLQQLTGANVILFYGPSAFQAIGFDISASLMAGVIVGGVNVTVTFVSILFGDRRPTKFKLKTGTILMFGCQIIIGILALLSAKEYTNSIILVTCIYISCYAWSWGSVWLVPNEILRTLKIPLAIQWSQNASANLIANTIMTFVFSFMINHLKFTIYCVIFSFVGLIMFVVLFLPETDGLSVEETSKVWKQHWFWRMFFTNNGNGDGFGGGGGEEGVGGNCDSHVIFEPQPTLYSHNISYNTRLLK